MAGWKAAVLKGKVILDCFWDLLMIGGGDEWNIFFMSIYVGISTHVWFLPHLFGKTHFYTESSYVAFTTLVCFIAHMCGNNQICVRKPHRDVLGFFHTCVVKHTHGLISPWNHGAWWTVAEGGGGQVTRWGESLGSEELIWGGGSGYCLKLRSVEEWVMIVEITGQPEGSLEDEVIVGMMCKTRAEAYDVT